MNFSNNDFLFKELVNTFAYTTATQNRDVCTDVSINGRRYTKYGTLQAVTFVGKLYKVGTPSEGYWPRENGRPEVKHNEKFVLFIGMSKQHPCDNKINKQLGYEIAETNALSNPQMIIEVQRGFNNRRFDNIVEHYLSEMNLEFIKTREEIIAEGKDPKKYNR